MAPPEKTFAVSELENRIHLHDVDYKEKSRKLPKDFDLKRDCELYELVQYSCTTQEEIEQRLLVGTKSNNGGRGGLECYPFVRLFRKCKHGNQEFNVETTAWEGRHKWKPSKRLLEEQAAAATTKQKTEAKGDGESAFARYGSYFWSGK
ncbi:hypothetical protein PMZ80_010179 [Knufia obscura]|uniref:Uncharacterized protein n=2 Tax=Knufia TaxID=430999 RepID=A0AAN8EDA9_9EURO|nr:hypothetical protein PMZ80_010179 [Knufia obscura]KAK5952919.1 hypothetical protein OHC33_006040 [Knufia fluminis]